MPEIRKERLRRVCDTVPVPGSGKKRRKERDRLDHMQVASKIVQTIKGGVLGELSQNIALFGPWGSGKTGILDLVSRLLGHESGREYVWHCIDAWHNQQNDLIVMELLRGLLPLCEKDMKEPLLRILWLLVGANAGIVLDSFLPGKLTKELVTAVRESTLTLGMPRSREQLIKDEFRKIVCAVTDNGKKTLVIAVDNLDRCRPEAALRMLETLFLITHIPHCAYIVAADQQVLVSFLNREYKGTAFSGTKYLEKIFPVYFRVPDPWVAWEYADAASVDDQILRLLKDILFKHTPWLDDAEMNERLWYYCSQPRAMRNPRRIKRLLYRLLTQGKPPKDAERAESLLFLIILSDLWPEAYEFLLTTDENTWLKWLNFMASPESERPAQGVLLEDAELQDYIRQVWLFNEKSFEESDIGDQEQLWLLQKHVARLGL